MIYFRLTKIVVADKSGNISFSLKINILYFTHVSKMTKNNIDIVNFYFCENKFHGYFFSPIRRFDNIMEEILYIFSGIDIKIILHSLLSSSSSKILLHLKHAFQFCTVVYEGHWSSNVSDLLSKTVKQPYLILCS